MPPRPGQKLPERVEQLDGATKAAILLLTLDQRTAGQLLKNMSTETVEAVTSALASLGEVPASLSMAVIEEFYNLRLEAGHVRSGGLDSARSLLNDALEGAEARRVMQQVQTHVQRAPFALLQKAQSANLLTFIQDEHPQTIALIVSHLPHEKASEILVGLPPQRQVEVVRRMANMEQAVPDAVREVEACLESRLASMLTGPQERVGGVESVAEILNLCDRTSEKVIIEGIEQEDPDLVEQIRRLMFVFDDIVLVSDKGIQTVLKEIDSDELCLALRTASDALKEKIFANMSQRAADLIREDMQYMGPVRLSDVEASQQRIVDVVRRLEDSGEIVISGRVAEKDMVV